MGNRFKSSLEGEPVPHEYRDVRRTEGVQSQEDVQSNIIQFDKCLEFLEKAGKAYISPKFRIWKEDHLILFKLLTYFYRDKVNAEKHKIDLVQIIPGKKIKKGVYIKIPYTIELECDYEKFGNFIVELEKNKRLIMIDDIYLRNEIEKMKIDNRDDTSYLNQKIEMRIHTVSLNKANQL